MFLDKAQTFSVGLVITAALGISAAVLGLIGEIDVNLLKSLDGLGTMGVLAFFAVQFFRANKDLSREFSETIKDVTKRYDDRIQQLFVEHRAERQIIMQQFSAEINKLLDNLIKQSGNQKTN